MDYDCNVALRDFRTRVLGSVDRYCASRSHGVQKLIIITNEKKTCAYTKTSKCWILRFCCRIIKIPQTTHINHFQSLCFIHPNHVCYYLSLIHIQMCIRDSIRGSCISAVSVLVKRVLQLLVHKSSQRSRTPPQRKVLLSLLYSNTHGSGE